MSTVKPDSRGSPVHNAAERLFLEVEEGSTFGVERIFRNEKVDINHRGPGGKTPLLWAATRGDMFMVESLMGYPGVDLDCRDDSGQTLIKCLSRRKDMKIRSEEEWIDHPEVFAKLGAHVRDENNRLPVSWAAEHGNTILMRMLIRIDPEGASNHRHGYSDDSSRTLLSWAAAGGHEKTVDWLLDVGWKGAKHDLTRKDTNGHTPMWWAAVNGHGHVVKRLTAHWDKRNGTIHCLIREDRPEAVRLLVEAGLDLTEKDQDGQPPLMAAIRSQKRDIIDILISSLHMYDMEDMRDAEGVSPLELAINNQDPDLICAIMRKTPNMPNIPVSDILRGFEKENHVLRLTQTAANDGHDVQIFAKSRILWINPAVHQDLEDFRVVGPPCSDVAKASQDLEDFRVVGPPCSDVAKASHLTVYPQDHHFPPSVRFESDGVYTSDEAVPFSVPLAMKCTMTSRLNPRKLLVRMPRRQMPIHARPLPEKAVISWIIVNREGNDGRTEWKCTEYPSTLSTAQVPEGGLHFICQFISDIKSKWLEICESPEQILSEIRQDQLEYRGASRQLIEDLAEHAQIYSPLRRHLAKQQTEISKFSRHYCRTYNMSRGLKQVDSALEDLEKSITPRLDALDQTIRDLLQIEFAWASVYEAQKSTSISMSMKRLSWVTFIFLPLTFSASLFGMNINVLSNSPHWGYYLAFAGGTILVTVASWLLFKFNPKIEDWTESQAASVFGKGRKASDLVQSDDKPPRIGTV